MRRISFFCVSIENIYFFYLFFTKKQEFFTKSSLLIDLRNLTPRSYNPLACKPPDGSEDTLMSLRTFLRFPSFLVLVTALPLFSCLEPHHKDGSPQGKGPALVNKPEPDLPAAKPRLCKLPDSTQSFVIERPKLGAATGTSSTPDFAQVKSALDSACAGCHAHPAHPGGFSYVSSYQAQDLVVGSKTQKVPGFFDAAETMRDALKEGVMPPQNIREKNPQAYENLAKLLDAWIAAGKPETVKAQESETLPPIWGKAGDNLFTDLGNCLPSTDAVGTDTDTDYYFSQTEQLPERLSETDMSTFDTDALAKKGTVVYAPEYPLWNDQAKKLRHMHLPAVIKSGKVFTPKPLEIQRSDRDAEPSFPIPENTRFYKTFFRAIKGVDGKVRYRPMETRIIVVRYAPRKPLYGTYVWSEDANDAQLLTTPYRDGTPWKDLSITLDHDRTAGTKKVYLVPAKHRCEQCHMGAENGSFVLGFTPLQLNRRDIGQAARDLPVGKDELDQVPRLIRQGILPKTIAAELPKLEYFPSSRMLNDHTLRAQGYMVGNCAHCHNPQGFAKQQAKVPMNLSAGKIFDFDTNLTSVNYTNRKIVHHEGDLGQSYLFHRFAAGEAELKFEQRMPLHSAGLPDCRGATLLARWIRSYDPAVNALDLNQFDPKVSCLSADDFSKAGPVPLEQDTTESSGPYQPRRSDWNDANNGMSQWFKDLRFAPALNQIANNTYNVDWWQVKPECKFPTKTIAKEAIRPWMVNADGTPKQPLGQLYGTTPGAYFFNTTCAKCHGRGGDADGPLAGTLNTMSGGSIRVANFKKGLFGNEGSNMSQFMQPDPSGKTLDYSGPYFIWMALEGTQMNPPPVFADLLGTNKAQMLKTIVDRCARQIPSNPKADKPYFRDFDLFRDVCTFENLAVTDASLQYDPNTGKPSNPAALEAWLRKAAANAGWSIYDYVKNQAVKGRIQATQNECEKVYPAP